MPPKSLAIVVFVSKARAFCSKSASFCDIVFSRCSHIWLSKSGAAFSPPFALRDALKPGLHLSPESVRRFLRFTRLSPDNFLEIIVASGGADSPDLRKVEFLYRLFRWSESQGGGRFRHLPRSTAMVVAMLAKAKMVEEAEGLLISLDVDVLGRDVACELYCAVIRGYAKKSNCQKCFALYSQAREGGVSPLSPECFDSILAVLVAGRKVDDVIAVYSDMLEIGLASSTSAETALAFIAASLSAAGDIVSVLGILRRAKRHSAAISGAALAAVVAAFCKKKDYSDMLNFMEEWHYAPPEGVGNNIISAACRDLGTSVAMACLWRMEAVGFVPTAVTFSILVCHSACQGGQGGARDALVHLAGCFERGLVPESRAYNAIIAGVFGAGLYRHAKLVFDDMVDRCIAPDRSTYEVLLAGYCRYKQLDEVEIVLDDMCLRGVAPAGPAQGESMIGRVVKFLGLKGLTVKLRRDNAVGLPKAEFFDTVGNGIYLDSGEEFEAALTRVLEAAAFPDFNAAVAAECRRGDVVAAMRMKTEAEEWGWELSVEVRIEVLKLLMQDPGRRTTGDIARSVEELLIVLRHQQLDSEILGLLARVVRTEWSASTGRMLLERLWETPPGAVDTDVYANLMAGFCQGKDGPRFRECWRLARSRNCSPDASELAAAFRGFCESGIISEAVEMLDCVGDESPGFLGSMCTALIEGLCAAGAHAAVCCAIFETAIERDVPLDKELVLACLVRSFAREGKLAEAIGMFQLLRSRMHPTPDTCLHILPALAHHGNIGQAIALMEAVGAEAVLNAMLQGCCRQAESGMLKEVLCATLRRHVRLAAATIRSFVRVLRPDAGSSRSGYYSFDLKRLSGKGDAGTAIKRRAGDYSMEIKRLCGKGDVGPAVKLLNLALRRGRVPSEDAYGAVVLGLCTAGDIDGAQDFLAEARLLGTEPNRESLEAVVRTLCATGRAREAREALEEMTVAPASREIYELVADACRADGDTSSAAEVVREMQESGHTPEFQTHWSLIRDLSAAGRKKSKTPNFFKF